MRNEKCEYENDGTRITQPGKFEGEPVFAPYYWGLGLEGFSDNDDGQVYTFRFTKVELAKPETAFGPELAKWLGRKRTLYISENDQGFVHCY